MVKPNKNFELNVKDVEQIENALLLLQSVVDQHEKKQIQKLLAKIYHQKNWYRPKDKIYVSG